MTFRFAKRHALQDSHLEPGCKCFRPTVWLYDPGCNSLLKYVAEDAMLHMPADHLSFISFVKKLRLPILAAFYVVYVYRVTHCIVGSGFSCHESRLLKSACSNTHVPQSALPTVPANLVLKVSGLWVSPERSEMTL